MGDGLNTRGVPRDMLVSLDHLTILGSSLQAFWYIVPRVLTKWESQGHLNEWTLESVPPLVNILLAFCLLVGFCCCSEEVFSFVWLRISHYVPTWCGGHYEGAWLWTAVIPSLCFLTSITTPPAPLNLLN